MPAPVTPWIKLFAYDPAGQVTAAAYGEAQSVAAVPAASAPTLSPSTSAPSFKPEQTFAYDAAGNRQSFQDLDGSKTEYTANEANQYTSISQTVKSAQSVEEPRYDKLGNLLTDDRNTYTWDSDIHLLSVETKIPTQKSQISTFKYDALHRRVARTESVTNTATLFVTDGWNVISEYSSSTSEIANVKSPSIRFTWSEDISGTLQSAGGIGGLLSTSTAKREPRTTNWFHYDSNGNVTRLSGVRGKETARYKYEAFGKAILARGSEAKYNRYQFSTKLVENWGGLVYYGYRYYHSHSGCWISKDPSAENGGINLYASLANNPVNNVDRLGLDIPWVSDTFDWLTNQAEQQLCDNIDSTAVCIVCCGAVLGVRGGLGMAETMAGLTTAAAGLVGEAPTLGASTIAVVGGCLTAADGIAYMASTPDKFEECRTECYNNFP